ncbi:MAG: CDP-diacylglycerol--glycerol-3-phosphate 3-phosphatidyltransferase [Pseudomonadota bacterium]
MDAKSPPTHRPAKTGQLVNIPNLLTYGRILAVPGIVALIVVDEDWSNWLALAVFITASVTDFLDGYLARQLDQHSAIGQMLDPIADKLLVSACLLALVAVDRIAGWTLVPALVILCREILVSGLREFLAGLQVSVPVSMLAKWKTTLQLIALGFLVIGATGDKVLPLVTTIGVWGLWISAIVTLYTGYEYFRGGMRHIAGD